MPNAVLFNPDKCFSMDPGGREKTRARQKARIIEDTAEEHSVPKGRLRVAQDAILGKQGRSEKSRRDG